MIEFIKGLSTLKQTIIALVLILVIGAFALNWYTNGKIKEAFVDFGNKQIELIKGDKDAVDKVDDKLGDDSILDWLLPKDTSSGQDSDKIYSGEISYTDTESTNDARIYSNSGSSTSQKLPNPSVVEQSKEGTTNPELLQKEIPKSKCTLDALSYLPIIDGCGYIPMYDGNGCYWGEVCY